MLALLLEKKCEVSTTWKVRGLYGSIVLSDEYFEVKSKRMEIDNSGESHLCVLQISYILEISQFWTSSWQGPKKCVWKIVLE